MENLRKNPLRICPIAGTKKNVLFILSTVLICFSFQKCNTSSGKNHQDQNLVSQPLDFREISKRATPAIVQINAYTQTQGAGPFDELLRQFREGDRSPRERQPGEENLRLRGFGSGVIIAEDGFIVTSLHIIEEAVKVEVVLIDKRVFTAAVIGRDPSTDLALLRINESNLPSIEYGNSDQLEVGEWIIAIGNPFNLTSTVTAGIVSAKGRNLNIFGERDMRNIESYIQTDAAVNPGNSGGALLNMEGRLGGIFAAIASPTGAFAGYSFAVPSNLVRKIVNDIREFGEVRRGFMGVMLRDLDANLARERNLETLDGVFIQEVAPQGPAAQAGLQQGDVIIAADDQEINSASQLQELIALRRPGDSVKLSFRRNGKIREAKVRLEGGQREG